MKCYVYLIFRPDGMPCYVGKGSGTRWKRHDARRKSNKHLAAIMAQAKMPLEVKIVKDGLTDAEAHLLEIQMIKEIGREVHGGPLVNNTDGGEGTTGAVMTEEWRNNRSKKAKEVWGDLCYREKQIAERKQRRHTEETKEKYRRSFDDPEMRERKLAGIKACRGRSYKKTPETLAKLRERMNSPEVRAKISKAAKERYAATAEERAIKKEEKRVAKLTGRPRGRRKGAKMPASTGRKISEALKGRVIGEKTRAAVAEANRNRVETPESRARRRDGQLRRHGKIP